MFIVPVFDVLLIFIALSAEKKNHSEKLYKAIKNGDEKAFQTFFNEHYDALFVFLRSRKMDPATAADLIQKAFIYIWENRHKIKPDLSLKAYLFRIAYTRMLNHIEQEKNFLDVDEHSIEISKTPHDSAEFSDLNEAFKEAISEMPEKRRLVFESCFLQELTYRETAVILDISIKTVENHMALAFKDLRKALKFFKEA